MQGIIIVNDVPRNCRFCQFRSEYAHDDFEHGFCTIDRNADCDRDAAYRPKNCPINTDESIVSFINLLKNGLKDYGNIKRTSEEST